jgi:hypothetical protein
VPTPAMGAAPYRAGVGTLSRICTARLHPQTLAPPYKYWFPASSPKIRRRLGISPCPPQEERRRGGEGEAGGEENWRPPVGEPEVAAPLDPHVAVRPAGEAA